MHSHDRTLLSKLGFSDPDKRDPRHDWACRYLAKSEVAGRILPLFIRPECPEKWEGSLSSFTGVRTQILGEIRDPRFEHPISKGEGQYKTTIGFIDLVLTAIVDRSTSGTKTERGKTVEVSGEKSSAGIRVNVEVKITPCSIGEIVRQIHLYREYLLSVDLNYPPSEPAMFLVATAFPLPPDDVSQLLADRIRHVFLGEKFNAFCEQQRSGQKAQGEMFEV